MSVISKICHDLGLPTGDRFTQDWAYELPDEYRTKEWLAKYIAAYSNNSDSLEVRRELMALSLDIINDLLASGLSTADGHVVKTLGLLFENYPIHIDLVTYWECGADFPEDCFALTPEIRRLKERFIDLAF
ncbi:hypothetical protein N7V53_20095 [Kosakonia sp. HypNH10]|uniref:hypothetical protein n=1 Tax=Kosakonia sp. HypNH10 TaxID=2980101 RepID=UPI0024499068|nr:hypothetical protein [Kosakonia sp. HypNH10]MDH2914799.1 hypothetical protein [Kosakonia sp. HypNH10]